MNPTYIIRATEAETQTFVYLAFDQRSGGYPYWASSHFSATNLDKSSINEQVENIKNDFQKGSGYYFKAEIIPHSLEYVLIAHINPVKFDTISSDDIMKQKITAKLNQEEITFLNNKGGL